MKIYVIASQLPRKNGLNHFYNGLISSFAKQNEAEEPVIKTVLIDSFTSTSINSTEEVITLNKYDFHAYYELANYLNKNCDVCLLQHDYNMFGGESGAYVLPLVISLKVPLITTLYSISHDPSFMQQMIIGVIAQKSESIVCMSSFGVDFLEHVYKIPVDKVSCIQHGVPKRSQEDRTVLREKYGFNGKKVLLSYGRFRRQKGYDTVIKSLPVLVNHHPDVKYVIIGDVCSNAVIPADEEYRNELKFLAYKKGVSQNIEFIEHYIDEDELMDMLVACDYFISPHTDEQQINSGTLPHALGAGAAILTTPFWHAKELIDEQRGVFFPFKSYTDLANKIMDLINRPKEVESLKRNSLLYGEQLHWSRIAQKYNKLIQNALATDVTHVVSNHLFNFSILPSVNLSFVKHLTDDIGILKSTVGNVVDLKAGYTLKDNASAILALAMANKYTAEDLLSYINKYLGCVKLMHLEKSTLYEELTFSKEFSTSERNSVGVGRLAWSLGYLYNLLDEGLTKSFVFKLFNDLQKLELSSPVAKAEMLIGCALILKNESQNKSAKEKMLALASELLTMLPHENLAKWWWFTDDMTEGSTSMLIALLYTYQQTKEIKYLNQAKRALRFIERTAFDDGIYVPKNYGQFPEGNSKNALSRQFSSEVFLMVKCYGLMYELTLEKEFLEKMYSIYLWYLGDNQFKQRIYDYNDGGCCAGFIGKDLNTDKGANSSLSHWLSYFSMMETYFYSYREILKK